MILLNMRQLLTTYQANTDFIVLHKQIRKKNVASVLFIITVPRESVFVFQGSFVKVKAIFMPLEYPCYFELHRIQCFFFIV